jgi:hypothetical protein
MAAAVVLLGAVSFTMVVLDAVMRVAVVRGC